MYLCCTRMAHRSAAAGHELEWFLFPSKFHRGQSKSSTSAGEKHLILLSHLFISSTRNHSTFSFPIWTSFWTCSKFSGMLWSSLFSLQDMLTETNGLLQNMVLIWKLTVYLLLKQHIHLFQKFMSCQSRQMSNSDKIIQGMALVVVNTSKFLSENVLFWAI